MRHVLCVWRSELLMSVVDLAQGFNAPSRQVIRNLQYMSHMAMSGMRYRKARARLSSSVDDVADESKEE